MAPSLFCDDYLFNCQNGTTNLKTFEFKEHDTNDYITKMSNVIYNPRASSEKNNCIPFARL